MIDIDGLFFQLLQVAIGRRKTLYKLPTSKEWALLFELSKKQALTAIAFAGVNRLKESCIIKGGASAEQGRSNPLMSQVSADDGFGGIGMDETLYLQWLGMTAKVAQRNKQVSEACVVLVKQYAHDGLKSCILKGQSNLVNYPEDLRECRNPGDIDVWCSSADPSGIDIAVSDLDGKGAHYERYHGKQAVIEYVKMLHRIAGTEPREGVRYHHIDAPSINTSTGSAQVPVEVEAHFRPLFLDSPLRNWRMQRWFRENEQFGVCDTKIGNNVYPTPTISFNAIYQLCHIYRHLFDEGIGLRQLLDYYFVLKALHIEQGELADRTPSMAQWAEGMGVAVKSNAEIMRTLSRFGMKKFASATMYVLQKVFAMPDEYLICQPDEKEGKFLLNEIMMAGNFGKYDPRIIHNAQFTIHNWEKTKHNLRLLTHYPEEVISEPFFRVYHWIWRRFGLWRF